MKQLGYKIIENRNFDEHVCLPVEYWVPKVNSCFLKKTKQIKTVAENVFYLKFTKKNNTWHLFTFRNLPKSLRPKGNAMLAAIFNFKTERHTWSTYTPRQISADQTLSCFHGNQLQCGRITKWLLTELSSRSWIRRYSLVLSWLSTFFFINMGQNLNEAPPGSR